MRVHGWTRSGLRNFIGMPLGRAYLSIFSAQLCLFPSLENNHHFCFLQPSIYEWLRGACTPAGSALGQSDAVSPKFYCMTLKGLSKFWASCSVIISCSYTTPFGALEQMQANSEALQFGSSNLLPDCARSVLRTMLIFLCYFPLCCYYCDCCSFCLICLEWEAVWSFGRTCSFPPLQL